MPEASAFDLAAFERDGYAFQAGSLISHAQCLMLANEFESVGSAGARHLLDLSSVQSVLNESALQSAIHTLLGRGAFAYKATFFDKNSDTNWLVAWHQDISIPVSQRLDIKGWRGWSTKDQVQYVQPPDNILSSLVALRLHLDPCEKNSGPLKVLVGSHVLGKIRQSEIVALTANFSQHVVTGGMGSALLMRPLLVHASSKSASSNRRRVLHLEFAAVDLPDRLEWHRRVIL